MSETTRIMGVPIPEKTDWKRVMKYCLFSAIVLGMLSFGIFYLLRGGEKPTSESTLTESDNLPVTDIPGAEAEQIIDDAPGVVTLSDKDFAQRVDMAANY